jgi:uncharacterized protein (DUF362 family)
MKANVAILKTSPETVRDDYHRLLELAGHKKGLDFSTDTVLKLNLSWTKYFPACSSQPWQVEGVVRALLADGFPKERLFPLENKTVVTNPIKGAANNLWTPILNKYGLPFIPLPDQEWIVYRFKSKLLKLNSIFPEGIEIPKLYVGKQIIHLPTVKTHGHSVTTGAIKNAFGGLLKEVRHYAHKHIHEVLVDLMLMQKELHPSVFAVMDGTVAGDGAGPRTMTPVAADYILASFDSVAIDATAARLMGYDPMTIPYLKMCDEMGLGCARKENIEIVGADVENVNLHFRTRRSFVIWGDQMLRRGPLRFLEKIALHSPLMVWAPAASNIYHDCLWYPTIGRAIIRGYAKTKWGRLFADYRAGRFAAD